MGEIEFERRHRITRLREIIRAAQYIDADFSEDIKEATFRHRESWIVDPLKEILAQLIEEYEKHYKWKV